MQLSFFPRAIARTIGTALSFILFSSLAHADLKLCNATSSRVGVAIGYQDKSGWATEGWWNIASQTCETLLKGALPSRFVYVHAVDYDRQKRYVYNGEILRHPGGSGLFKSRI